MQFIVADAIAAQVAGGARLTYSGRLRFPLIKMT